MNSSTFQLAGLMGLACLALIGVQWWWLRRLHGRRIARQHLRHVQQQQTVNRNLEQAKRQIEQLQHDLAAARLQIKRLSVHAVNTQQQSRAREALQRTLDEAAQATARRAPTDGFADTLPLPQYPEYLALLATR